MTKFIITFGHGQLKGYDVDPLSVALVIPASSAQEAREKVFLSAIGTGFCTHYPYNAYIEKFVHKYKMVEWSLDDLLAMREE